MKKTGVKTSISKKTKESDISKFLKSTGFVLEMEVADYLKSKGYAVKVNEFFLDYDENKNREIDLIATKKINEIELTLIIECKQSKDKDWIFICSDKRPPLYYSYVKYSPKLEHKKGPEETKIFNNTHVLSGDISIAQNAIIKQKNGKQAQELTIRECLKKLPKVLVDYAYSNNEEDKRIIYVPLVVFSNQLFSASYDGKLITKEHEMIQHSTVFDSQVYKHKYSAPSVIFSTPLSLPSNDTEATQNENIPVSNISRDLGTYYLIDFSTKKGLNKYLKVIEKGVNSINLKHWKLKSKEEPPEIPPSK